MTRDLESHLRRAVDRLEKTRAELNQLKQFTTMPIAVIGMSCRLPGGSNTPEAFWEKLLKARPLIQDVPASRWNKADYYSLDRSTPGKMYTTRAGFIDDIEYFDAAFFNISPREAVMMDPQQRLLIEETWQAFESGGIDVSQLKGSNTAVYFGCGSHDYANYLNSGNKDDISAYYGTGNSSSIMAGRVAYFFDFHGSAITLDTSCSSSLVAIHHACQALRTNQCSLAVAGGVNAILTPDVMITFCKANMLSLEGLSKTFDAEANGYVRGEGVGVLILKRLDDAIRDKDTIFATIIANGVNHDGASSGLTSPNGEAQAQLMTTTLSQFAVSPQSISYVEAHGTGTPLGDPIEINALNKVFAHTHSKENPMYIGSVKTNIGHLEAAAGISGMIKVILSMQHKTIPAHLNLHSLNPLIDISKIPFEIPTKARAWDIADGRRRASVSSFGFSGTNAYIVLEEFSNETSKENIPDRNWHPVIISAKTKTALKAKVGQLRRALSDSMSLQDIAYTLNSGRVSFEHTLQFICPTLNDLKKKLSSFPEKDYRHLENPEAALVLSFGDITPDNAWRITQQLTGSNQRFLKTIQAVFAQRTDEPQNIITLHSNELSGEIWHQYQFAFIFALLDLLEAWGVLPDYVVGDSNIQTVLNAFLSQLDGNKERSEAIFFLPQEKVETINEDFLLVNLFQSQKNNWQNAHMLQATHALFPDDDIWQSLIKMLFVLHNLCREVDWVLFDDTYNRKRLILPGYPFERKKYWYESKTHRFNLELKPHGLLSREHRVSISLDIEDYLNDHMIYKQPIYPAAGFIERMIEAVQEFTQDPHIELHSFEINAPLRLKKDNSLFIAINGQDVVISIEKEDEPHKKQQVAFAHWQAGRFSVKSNILVESQDSNRIAPPYEALRQYDIDYGLGFQSISELYRANDKALAMISLKLKENHTLLSILDGAFQAVVAFVMDEIDDFADAIYLPHSFERLQLFDRFPNEVTVHLLLLEQNANFCVVDIELYDSSHKLLCVITRYRARKVPRTFLQKQKAALGLFYTLEWHAIQHKLNETNTETLKNIAKIDLRKAVDNEIIINRPDTYFNLVKQRLERIKQDASYDQSKLLFLVENANPVLNEEVISAQRFFTAMIKSLRLEYPNVQFFCMDCSPKSREYLKTNTRAILSYMIKHLIYDIAIREGQLFQSKLQALKLTKESLTENIASATYLILGGTSAISLSLAKKIRGEQAGAEIVLVARKGQPKSKLLQTLLTDAKVQWVTGDITHNAFIKELVGLLNDNRLQKIVIVQAAGVLDDRHFQNLTSAQINRVVMTKVNPVLYLVHECKAQGVSIHSMLCLSSVASTFGSQGQANYAAANAFLEGYMYHLRSQGIIATAIALAPVQDTRMAKHSLLLKQYPEIGISLLDAVDALIRALQQPVPAVFTVINQRFLQKIQKHSLFQSWFCKPIEKPHESEKNRGFSELVNSLDTIAKSARLVYMKQFLMTECARVLQLNLGEFDENSGFFELGMDSIMAIELFEVIQQSLIHRVKLAQTILFDLPNIALLSVYLVTQLFPEDKSEKPIEPAQEESSRIDQMTDEDLLAEIEKMNKDHGMDSHE